MLLYCKRLGLGFVLIALASGLLLATDSKPRSKEGPHVDHIAILQHASIPVLDEGTQGAIDGLAEKGFRAGENLQIDRFNAEGDAGTANTAAGKMVNGDYDLLISISTVSLQTLANANRERHRPHVFGLVADPFSAGVGLDRDNPMKHPPYLVGQGIFLPVEESLRLAQQMSPGLKAVGVVWNPSESNSRAYVEKARSVCQKLGLQLLETQADNSAGVQEATQALIGRGAQTIWVGGDVTVLAAIDAMVQATKKAGIPVISITPGKPERGTLLDIGVDFYECGRLTGHLAAEILHGTDPATIPIRDVLDLVPRRIILNRQTLALMKENWRFPEDLVRRAVIVVDEKGVVHQTKR